MQITRDIAAAKIADYLHGSVTREELVDWAERSMMDADFTETDTELLAEIIGRLGVSDVAEFKLRRQDYEDFLRRLKHRANGASQSPPPVAPKPKLLPFYDPNFSWETFEGFFCDFLAAAPELKGKDGNRYRVVGASLYGQRGESQQGIDIRAEMSNGEIWAFQCKHYKSWGPQDTKEVITKCDYKADRRFLLVTRRVSAESREVVAKHPEWELWDSDDISREFLRLPGTESAKILYTSFGPGWAKELAGLPGSGPLITADAKFAPLLEEGRSFHHRLEMVGRRTWLAALDRFIEAADSRVFFVVGRGGLGKSRLLREWSRGFATRHKGWTLRFVSDSPADFAAALQASAKPLALVFDDAHRLNEVRRALFAELPSRKDIKLVLALRPGPVGQVETELIDAGFDTTHIEKPAPLRRLASEEALQLAEAALGPELADRFRLPLRNLSRDVPLLAVLAAELLKRGELKERDLQDTAEFRNHVFAGLLRDAGAVESRFGAARVQDLLKLLAVLAPVKIDAEFLKRGAALLRGDTQPHHVAEILSALDDAGLLLTTGAGIRVSPDLLSDHLAYAACYDKQGRDTTFAERVIAAFPPDQFPRLMQHLAEAEWRALKENASPDSIVEPLWRLFIKRFEASSFYGRAEQLKAWANIAHLQPRRTLELAQLALRLDSAPPEENRWVRSERWNSHGVVLDGLPTLLKPLAEHHPEYVSACLDALWGIGRGRLAPRFNSQSHPITKIGEIGSYAIRKTLAIQDEVLKWLEHLLLTDEWTNEINGPGWLLTQMLNPFFATGLDESWSTGNTIHWRTVPLHLANTSTFRDRALALIRQIVARKSVALTLATFGVIEHAMRRAYLGPSEIPQKFHDAWLVERKKALAVLREIIAGSDEAIIHFRSRTLLLAGMRYEDQAFRAACREVFDTIPDSLDLQIVRAVLGNYWDEFEANRPEDWQDQAKRRWEQFIRMTANAILSEWPAPDVLLSKLRDRHDELVRLGFYPNFYPLLHSIAEGHPDTASAIVRGLIAQPSHPLGALLESLLGPITREDADLRSKTCEDAVASGTDELKVGAIASFTAWRQEGDLPPRAWELLQSCAQTASASVADAIIRFVWLNDAKADIHDWALLAAMPVSETNWWIAHRIIARAGDLLEGGKVPTPELAGAILQKLDGLKSLGDHEVEHALGVFAKYFPGQVFLLMWRRKQHPDREDHDFEVVPFDFDKIQFADVLSDPQAASVIRDLEDQLIEGAEMDHAATRVLQIATMQDAENMEARLLQLLERAERTDQIERVASFAAQWDSWPVVLSCPGFTRALLVKAKAINTELHQKLFRRLQGLPGSRGSSAYQPNEEWKSLVDAVEQMAQQYKKDPELGRLYEAAVENEREWMKRMATRLPDEDDELAD